MSSAANIYIIKQHLYQFSFWCPFKMKYVSYNQLSEKKKSKEKNIQKLAKKCLKGNRSYRLPSVEHRKSQWIKNQDPQRKKKQWGKFIYIIFHFTALLIWAPVQRSESTSDTL